MLMFNIFLKSKHLRNKNSPLKVVVVLNFKTLNEREINKYFASSKLSFNQVCPRTIPGIC